MEDQYVTRRYIVFEVSEIEKIDFSEILEDSVETLRKSIDGTKTFVKYDLPQPQSLSNLTTASVEYTHDQFMAIIQSAEWTVPYQAGLLN